MKKKKMMVIRVLKFGTSSFLDIVCLFINNYCFFFYSTPLSPKPFLFQLLKQPFCLIHLFLFFLNHNQNNHSSHYINV